MSDRNEVVQYMHQVPEQSFTGSITRGVLVAAHQHRLNVNAKDSDDDGMQPKLSLDRIFFTDHP